MLLRAVGGAGLVMVEATAVEPRGRISAGDLGIWDDAQVPAYARIAKFVAGQGAVPAIQLAHAGRKASTELPWQGGQPLGERGWEAVAPSALPFGSGWTAPRALAIDEIGAITRAWADAARRARIAGFQVVEIMPLTGTCCTSSSLR